MGQKFGSLQDFPEFFSIVSKSAGTTQLPWYEQKSHEPDSHGGHWCWEEITKLNNGENFTRNPGVQLLERVSSLQAFSELESTPVHSSVGEKRLHRALSNYIMVSRLYNWNVS